jgi:hypothetical protein
MATRPFPVDARLTAIALAFRNPDISLIADDVLPRTPTDAEFKWLEYDLAQGFTVPDTKVARKSKPNEIDFKAVEHVSKVVDHGLDDVVPNEDIDDDNQGVDPLGTSAGYLSGLIDLGREGRVASLVFDAANHDNNTTLSGSGQWDHADADPVAAIGDALDVPIMRPNIAVFGQTTWTKLRRNRLLVQAIKGTAQDAGQVSRQEFAEFFEIQQVLVGQGFVNTAKRGQPVAMSRVWGKHAAFIYRDRTAGPQAGITYGFTAQKGAKVSGQIPEPTIGLSGSVRVRTGERTREVITAKALSFFFQNAVS